MPYLTDAAEKEAKEWIRKAAAVAERSLCLRARAGAVIVKDGKIIGEGYNAPPKDDSANRKCEREKKPFLGKPGYDATCCMHAEWRAILEAVRKNPESVPGSTLYFSRIDAEGALRPSAEPLCTVCSRLSLDAGIETFVLFHENGVCAYPTPEYNDLSYSYIHKK